MVLALDLNSTILVKPLLFIIMIMVQLEYKKDAIIERTNYHWY